MEEIRLTTGDANNGPQFVASGGLNPSSNDNGCAQSAGNGCDLMQQQENKGTCRGHEHPCSVNERQDVCHSAGGFFDDQRAASPSQRDTKVQSTKASTLWSVASHFFDMAMFFS